MTKFSHVLGYLIIAIITIWGPLLASQPDVTQTVWSREGPYMFGKLLFPLAIIYCELTDDAG